MLPKLKEGDLCLYLKLKKRKINSGDIIVLKHSDKVMIKRVVGIPKQIVSLHNGIMTINGKEFEEYYLNKPRTASEIEYLWKPQNDEFVILGDNDDESTDSRLFNVIKKDMIIGKMICRIYPINFSKL